MKKRRKASKAAGRTNLIPIILIGAGALLILAVLLWQAISNSPANTSGSSQSDLPYPEVERVTVADARTALDQQSAVFLDVRDTGSFDAGHIPGAINIPLEQIESRIGELDANQRIITYCT